MTPTPTPNAVPPHSEGRRSQPFRVVLTGGPGGGKTTAADLLRREIGSGVIVVPEAATLLFSGGFPRPTDPDGRRSLQAAVYHVQRNLEDVQAASHPDRVLLCDRGTVDGGAYWPDGSQDFFEAVGSTHQRELERYDAVIFFETAARGGHGFGSENTYRTESQQEAVNVDTRLRALWERHPRFTLIPHSSSFFEKMTVGFGVMRELVPSPPETPGPAPRQGSTRRSS